MNFDVVLDTESQKRTWKLLVRWSCSSCKLVRSDLFLVRYLPLWWSDGVTEWPSGPPVWYWSSLLVLFWSGRSAISDRDGPMGLTDAWLHSWDGLGPTTYCGNTFWTWLDSRSDGFQTGVRAAFIEFQWLPIVQFHYRIKHYYIRH